ncbi:chemotaxis protein CheW (plasmid) [Pseudomonas marginalis]|uniref:chemotaxis protein CheW n=1 Tax=Pseudomonas TaxID=286 RepID=UPI00386F3388
MSSITPAQHLAPAPAPMEYLAFNLGSEEYGVDIQKVQELRGYDAVTRIANAPDYIKGVVNLRGVIVPIIDMRIKFNLGTPTYDQFTVVIILNIGGRGHCCKVSDEAAFCLIQRPYISKTLLTRRISPRGSP